MIPGITASRMRAGSSPGGEDPHWNNVVLLMHFEDSIADQKGGNYVVNESIGYSTGKFGRCMQLTTGAGGVLESTPTTTMDLPGDFAIEAWIKPEPGFDGVVINRFGTIGVTGDGSGWQIYIESSGGLSFYDYLTGVGGRYPIRNAGPDVRDGVWHHVAVTRASGTLRLFGDGDLLGTSSSNYNYTSETARLSIGFQEQGGNRYPMRGGIDDVRITKGVARYTASFTRPVAPFPNS